MLDTNDNKPRLLLGAHMSIAGGVEQSLYRGAELGCTVIQIFTASNRQWSFKEFSPEISTQFKQIQQEKSIQTVISHASYLINFGSSSNETVKKSIIALEHELIRCHQLAIPAVVLHPGAGLTNEKEIITQIADALNQVLSKVNNSCMILLENMAGQGSSVGRTFEQLAELRTHIKQKEKIGICIDTCHLWAAGYNFSTEAHYDKLWQDFDTIIGFKNLKAMHLNDSHKPLGSRIDRHQDIGKGTMGLEPFRLLINDERLFSVPKILETPKDDSQEDARNLATLKSLLSKKTKTLLHS